MGEFAGAGTAVGIEIWRIEKMVPTKLPGLDGKLYQGDSYILLSYVLDPLPLKSSIFFFFNPGRATSEGIYGDRYLISIPP